MTRCEEIIANVKMEECYAGLSLVFDGNDDLREEIGNAIDKVAKDKKMTPLIFDNSQNRRSLIIWIFFAVADLSLWLSEKKLINLFYPFNPCHPCSIFYINRTQI